MKIVLPECLSKYYTSNCLYLKKNKNLDIIMFEKWIDLTIKQTIIHKYENVTNNLKL